MAAQTTYLDDKLIDHANGVTAYTMPTVYVAMIIASAGVSPRSTAVTAGETTVPATPNGHMYRCTTAGTTGSTEPTWPTTSGGTVTDGTAVWTEATPDFQGNSNLVEASYTGYARVALSGDMGSASAGSASNTTQIGFGTNTSTTTQVAAAWMTFDASTAGNGLRYAVATAPLSVAQNITPNIPVGDMTTSMS